MTRNISLPNGEYLQIKFGYAGLVYDRYDKNDNLIEELGYDLYIETCPHLFKEGELPF